MGLSAFPLLGFFHKICGFSRTTWVLGFFHRKRFFEDDLVFLGEKRPNLFCFFEKCKKNFLANVFFGELSSAAVVRLKKREKVSSRSVRYWKKPDFDPILAPPVVMGKTLSRGGG